MASLEIIALVLTGLCLTVSLFYHANILNNANKTQQLQLETRQAQLYTQMIQEFFDEKYMKKNIHMLKMWWEDYDDFERKYGSDNNEDSYAERYSFWYFMNNI